MTQRTLFMFPGRSREERLRGVATGEAPREFFYGYLALKEARYDVAFADSRQDPEDAIGRLLVRLELLRNSLTNLGYSRQRVRALARELGDARLAISFTDGFSLSLGLYGRELPSRPTLVGGFHGLADAVGFTRPGFRWAARRLVRRALAGLDHMFFFGEPDRQRSIELFGIPESKTSLYRFGIDTEFWSPEEVAEEDVVFSVGSDPKRDYETLLKAPTDVPLMLLTRLPVTLPPGRNVDLIRGSYHGSSVTDMVLRDMYMKASIVAVPLLDVWQPTGYSVTLQAMACGRPVVLSDIRGLWDRDVFQDGKNCLLVPPGDPAAMAEAIDRLRGDVALRRRLGAAGRKTAERHFGLDRMGQDITSLVGRFGIAPEQPETNRKFLAS